ncbi:hypothetical protein KO361_05940 [Candidatus Woesearchaeota archaeon]|nr:hypothetical protein [Candidatus Woesearchaeota archaeon]
MNKILLKRIICEKDLFVPSIFTVKQFEAIKKYLSKINMSNSEKKSLYTSIAKKVKALEFLYDEKKDFFIRGNVISSRIDEAKRIISSFKNEKVFVGGSFLFSDTYNDIDVFIIRNKGYKEEFKDNLHIIYLTEKKLSDAIFQSVAKVSVSNFNNSRSVTLKKPFLYELMSLYHESYIQIKEHDKKREAVRDLVFFHEYFVNKNVISPEQLKKIVFELEIFEIDKYFIDVCNCLFSKKYLYVEVLNYLKSLSNAINSESNVSHLVHYKTVYEGLIHG